MWWPRKGSTGWARCRSGSSATPPVLRPISGRCPTRRRSSWSAAAPKRCRFREHDDEGEAGMTRTAINIFGLQNWFGGDLVPVIDLIRVADKKGVYQVDLAEHMTMGEETDK